MTTLPTDRLQSIFEAGVAHHQAGRLAEAEQAYGEVLAADPGHAVALNLLGMVRHQAGDLDRAVELIGRAVAREPDYAQAHNNLGNALTDQGRTEDAIAAYRRALDIAPDYALAHYNLGNSLKALDRTDEAAACYRRAIEIVPTLAQAHHNLGVLVADLGELDDAAAHYRRALELAPDYAEAHYNLGNLHRAQGRTEDAIAAYRRATELDPDNAAMNFTLSAALGQAGRPADARQTLETTLRRSPVLTFACTNSDGPHATILSLTGMQATYLKFYNDKPTFTGGMLDTNTLIDREKFTVHQYFILDNNLLDGAAPLPPFDIVLNGIVEPDLEPISLDVVEAYITRENVPYINHPRQVRRTTRDNVCQILAGIDNLVVPKVVKETLAANDSSLFMPVVEKHGLRFPLIVRFAGGHVGAGMTKVDREEDFARFEFVTNTPDFYFTEYHDYKNKKGLYCKYRIYFVDGIHFPGHAIIFNNWNVHIDAGLEFMKDHDWMTRTDENFLWNYVEHLGQTGFDTMDEIGRRIGLDFFGIDFAVLPDGKLLLFECNPAMAYRGSGAPWSENFNYREKYVHRLPDAFSDLVLARIRG